MSSDFRLGKWVVRPNLNSVSQNGATTRLEPKVMEVLLCLASHPGEPVSKDAILKSVWPDTFVSDDVLIRSISELRRILGDDARDSRIIETIPKRGYRLLPPVELVSAKPATDQTISSPSKPGGHRRLWMMSGIVLGSAVLLSALLVAANMGGLRDRLLGVEAVPEIHSLAVLPLQNLSGDPSQDYFADGMTEELITELSRINALKVVSRTSVMHYKKTDKSLPQIARELGVDAIVEGSVQRSDAEVRITAQLVYAPEDRNVWAQTYVRGLQGALTLESDAAADIADQVRQKLSPRPKPTRTSANPEAYDLYLRGRYYWNQRTEAGFWKAIESFRQAIDKDPNYAQAYAGLADSYVLLGPNDVLPANEVYPLARTAALKALYLDDTLAEAHASLGFVILLYDWNAIQAEHEFQRAIQLNPNYPTAHHWYAYDLAATKRSDESVAEIRRALELDPLSPIINADLSQILLLARRPDEAIQQCQKTIGLDPQFTQTYWYLGLSYEQKGMFDPAFEAFLKALPALSRSQSVAFRSAYRAWGIKGYWHERVLMLERQSKDHYVSPFTIAVAYARMGQKDKAVNNLAKALEERYPSMIFVQIEPVFDGLRGHRRFRDLVRRMGLPQ